MPDLSFKVIEKFLLELKHMRLVSFHVDFVSIEVYEGQCNISLTGVVAQKLLLFVSLNLFLEGYHVDPGKSPTEEDEVVEYLDIVVFTERLT